MSSEPPTSVTGSSGPNVASLASHIRIARPTSRIAELLAFYCDGLGLRKIDGFHGHRGYSGAMVGLPDSELQIEFTSHDDHLDQVVGLAPTKDNLLVFYLPDASTVAAFAQRLTALGHPTVEPENPYWLDLGSVTFEDPDGWRVVLVPSVYA